MKPIQIFYVLAAFLVGVIFSSCHSVEKVSKVCPDVMGMDGPQGFRWEPAGPHGRLRVYLPEEFQTFKKTSVILVSIAKEESMVLVEIDAYGRQVWEASGRGSAYTGRVIADTEDGKDTCIWEVRNPTFIQD